MWMLENNTPFAAERAWITEKNGTMQWLVAVKGTYLVDPDGSVNPAEKQEELCRIPVYSGVPGESSLVYESDFSPAKPATDVILNGHAYAPGGKPCTQVDVTMKAANIKKTLRVYGDRFWENGLTDLIMTDPEPFDRMPVVYERAYGGTDERSDNPEKHGYEPYNPVGTGFVVDPEHLTGQRIPNIEYPDQAFFRPAGFGTIAPFWSPRKELAGACDEKWRDERFPLYPLDFSDRFYMCAPEDQRASPYLIGGESVELTNLTSTGFLKFELPMVSLRFITSFYGRTDKDHRADLHTIIIEPDVPRVMMVWHTYLSCHRDAYRLKATAIYCD